MKWFIHSAGQKEGPYSIEELRAKISAGSLVGDVFVWREGFPAWKKLAEVPELTAPSKSNNPAARHSGDLSVFTELPKVANEKTGFIDGNLLKDLKKEAKKAQKIERKIEQKLPSQPKASRDWGATLRIPMITIAVAGALAGVYYLVQSPTKLPRILDITPADYARLQSAVAGSLSKEGPLVEIALSTEDVVHPQFYIASNLPDTDPVDITIKQILGTSVEPSPAPTVIHLDHLIYHLAKTDKIAIPPGDYSVTVSPGADPKKNLAVARFFLGGIKNTAFQSDLEQARAKRRERAEGELRDINQGVAQLDVFQGIIQKLSELFKQGTVTPKTLARLSELEKEWDDTEKFLPQRSSIWHADVLEATVLYPNLLHLGRESWQQQKETNLLFKKYFSAPNPKLIAGVTEQTNKALEGLVILKAQVEKTHTGEIQ